MFLKAKQLTNIPTGTFLTREGEYAENIQNKCEKGPFDSQQERACAHCFVRSAIFIR